MKLKLPVRLQERLPAKLHRILPAIRTQTVLLTLLVLAVGITWVLRVEKESRITYSEPNQPDYLITQFVQYATNESGQLAHRVHADQVTHFPHEAYLVFTQPRATLFEMGNPRWNFRANHGKKWDKEKKTLLTGQVEVNKAVQQAAEKTTITTEKIVLFSNTEYVETDAPIQFNTAQIEMSATGANAWLEEGKIHLLSNVETIYWPQLRKAK